MARDTLLTLAPQGFVIPMDPPTAEQAADVTPTASEPWNFPTWDSKFFDRVGVIALPALATPTQIVAFAMPAGFTGVVKWLSNIYLGGGFTDGSNDLVWQVLIDGQPVEDYEAINAQLGTLPIPTETFIPVFENQTVSVQITVNVVPGGGASTGARLKGWRWPSTRKL